MVGFTDLPGELVVEILHQAQPQDIESLSAVCKRVYLLAQSLLHEHRHLKRLFSSTTVSSVGDDYDEPQDDRVIRLLMLFLRQPRIALYVTKFCLTCHEEDEPHMSDANIEAVEWQGKSTPFTYDMMNIIEQVVRSSKIMPIDEADIWLDSIRGGVNGSIVALFLILLPNIVNLKCFLSVGHPLARVFSNMVHRMGDAKENSYLQQLKEVKLDMTRGWADPVSCEFSCDLMHAFMSIPSIQRLDVSTVRDTDDTESWINRPQRWKTSNVTQLACAGFDAKQTYEMIRQTHCLISFTWRGCPDNDHHCDTYLLSDALADQASLTLEMLSLQTNDYAATQLTSLRDFRCLHEIDVSLGVLFNSDGSDISSWPSRLPSSLEKLALNLEDSHTIQTPQNFCNAFRSLLRAKAEQRIQVKEILIRMKSADHCREAYDHVQYPCSCAGILLHHTHPSGGGHMKAACGKCDDCMTVVDGFLREAGI